MLTIPPVPDTPVRRLSDTALWDLLQDLGHATRLARQRFLALLPEVGRRRLHRRMDFPSLLSCAQQLGGVSQRAFDDILALHRRLTSSPTLRNLWYLVEAGEVGWSVVARVPQDLLEADPKAWRRNFLHLSKREIEALVRAARPAPAAPPAPALAPAPAPTATSASSMPTPAATPSTRPIAGACRSEPAPSNPRAPSSITPGRDPEPAPQAERNPARRYALHLTPDEEDRLRLLLQAEQRRTGEAISLSELLTRLVRETWLSPDEPAPGPEARALRAPTLPGEPSRAEYRQAVDSAERSQGADPPPLVVQYVRKRARDLCERGGCRNPGIQLHHLLGREGENPHHPAKLAWVCGTCHGLTHQGRIQNPHDPPWLWHLRDPTEEPKSHARDHRYQGHRRAHRAHRHRRRSRAQQKGKPARAD